eukprot:g44821.t1
MAETFSQEAVLDFLLVHRGKVRNADLTAHFTRFLRDPERQRQSREQFKKFVNSLAVVRVENGVKYIVLKKRYVEFLPEEIHFSSDVLVPARPEGEEKMRHRAVESCPREHQPVTCPRERQPASCPRECPAVAEDRQREAALSQTHRHLQAQHKPARQQFAKLSVDVADLEPWLSLRVQAGWGELMVARKILVYTQKIDGERDEGVND